MGLLREADREGLRQELAKLTTPVKLVFFSQALNCEYCPLTRQVLEEITSLTDKVIVQEYNFAIDREVVAQYHIVRVPAIAIVRLEAPKVLVPGNDAPRDAEGERRGDDAPLGERSQQIRHAAILFAQSILPGNAHIVKHDLGGLRRMHSQGSDGRAHAQTRHAALHDEQTDATATPRPVRHRRKHAVDSLALEPRRAFLQKRLDPFLVIRAHQASRLGARFKIKFLVERPIQTLD